MKMNKVKYLLVSVTQAVYPGRYLQKKSFSWRSLCCCMLQRAIREDLAGYGEPIPENMLEWDIEGLDVSF